MSQAHTTGKVLAGTVGAVGLLLATGQAANAASVTVTSNDTVWSLAQEHGVSVKSIEKLNKIQALDENTDLIFVGQKIQVSGSKKDAKATTSTTKTKSVSTAKGTYTVKAGDTLWALADQYHTSVHALQTLNGLSGDVILVGQSIQVPGATTKSAATPAVAKDATKATSESAKTDSTSAVSATSSSSEASATSSTESTSAASVSSQSTSTSSASQDATSTSTTSVAKDDSTSTTSASSVATTDTTSASSQAPKKTVYKTAVAETSSSTASAASQAPASAASSSSTQTQSQSSATSASSQAPVSAAQSSSTTSTSTASQASSSAATSSSTATSQASQQSSSAASTTNTSTNNNAAANNNADLATGSVTGLALKLASANIPYVWGGASLSGMDCSGLVSYVYQHAAGISLPHSTTAQEGYVTTHSVADAKPGDILFWGSRGATYHDAIYIGNNQYVAAPQSGQNVKVSTINSYFMPSFAGTLK